MNKGLIYLIQPVELIGTERYKIGMTSNPNLDRCKNGYKKGSRYICIMECNEPLVLERNIKNIFNEKFTLIAGKEYYEGNEKYVLNTFNNLVIEYNNSFLINIDNFEYKCMDCNKHFKRNENLKYHIAKNACKTNKAFCKYCKKGFTSSISMNRHIRQYCKVKMSDYDNKKERFDKLVRLEEKNLLLEAKNKAIEDELNKIKKKYSID